MAFKLPPHKTAVRYDRVINIEPQVVRWRKLNKRFKVLKKKLLDELLNRGFDRDSVRLFLDTPQESLGGKAPRALLKPSSMPRLLRWARQHLADTQI